MMTKALTLCNISATKALCQALDVYPIFIASPFDNESDSEDWLVVDLYAREAVIVPIGWWQTTIAVGNSATVSYNVYPELPLYVAP